MNVDQTVVVNLRTILGVLSKHQTLANSFSIHHQFHNVISYHIISYHRKTVIKAPQVPSMTQACCCCSYSQNKTVINRRLGTGLPWPHCAWRSPSFAYISQKELKGKKNWVTDIKKEFFSSRSCNHILVDVLKLQNREVSGACWWLVQFPPFPSPEILLYSEKVGYKRPTRSGTELPFNLFLQWDNSVKLEFLKHNKSL